MDSVHTINLYTHLHFCIFICIYIYKYRTDQTPLAVTATTEGCCRYIAALVCPYGGKLNAARGIYPKMGVYIHMYIYMYVIHIIYLYARLHMTSYIHIYIYIHTYTHASAQSLRVFAIPSAEEALRRFGRASSMMAVVRSPEQVLAAPTRVRAPKDHLQHTVEAIKLEHGRPPTPA